MTEVLGYQRFAVAGGDGGSALAQILAIDRPESVVGIHLTDLGWHTANVDPTTLSKAERAYLVAGKKVFMADMAYAMVQATRPRAWLRRSPIHPPALQPGSWTASTPGAIAKGTPNGASPRTSS